MSDTPWTDKHDNYIETWGIPSDDVRELERSHNRLLAALRDLVDSYERKNSTVSAHRILAAQDAIKQAIC